jgi:hypothetical protein
MPDAVSFARDILPLFTPMDIACMARHGVRLADYQYMSVPANARNVASHLDGTQPPRMPPGAAWPAANISLFQAWMTGGYQP